MTEEYDIKKSLIEFKIIFGLGLIGIFSVIKAVFDYQHIPMGVGYIALIIGVGNIIWAIYDYRIMKKMKKMKIKNDADKI